jgi:hypothetical protein
LRCSNGTRRANQRGNQNMKPHLRLFIYEAAMSGMKKTGRVSSLTATSCMVDDVVVYNFDHLERMIGLGARKVPATA